jgi:microcystin-dependent protein
MESSIAATVQPGPEQQDAPLTEAERKLLVRLLSDPTYFPIQFRTWLKNYLETAGLQLPASSIVGGTGKLINLPAGIILPIAGSITAPNVLPCDGRSLLRADFPKLFAVIGVTWGAADGTHFNLPDFRDRALYGVGTFLSLGATDGVGNGSRGGPRHFHQISQTSQPNGAHGHSVDGSTDYVGDHSHTTDDNQGFGFTLVTGTAGDTRGYLEARGRGMSGAGGHDHGVGGETSVDGSHTHLLTGPTTGGFLQDRPSYAGVNYVITTDV